MTLIGSSRIALTGYGRSGKDTLAAELMALGYERTSFGDIIKRQLDEVCRKHMGFSAFTEVDEEKEKIRKWLLEWGYSNEDNIIREMFDTLPERAVNNRLLREREARLWRDAGGIIVEVTRSDYPPKEPSEEAALRQLRELVLIDLTVVNDHSFQNWQTRCQEIAAHLSNYPRP